MVMPEVHIARVFKCIFFGVSVAVGYMFMFKMSEDESYCSPPPLFVYGLVSLLLGCVLLKWHDHITGWVLFKKRYGWQAKSLVGIGMLVVATFVAVKRETTAWGFIFQASLVASLYSFVQMLAPTTDFGWVNFSLRVPALTSYKLWKEESVVSFLTCGVVYLCAAMMILFHEYYMAERDRRDGEAAAAENERIRQNLEDATAKTFGLRSEVEELKKKVTDKIRECNVAVRDKDIAVQELQMARGKLVELESEKEVTARELEIARVEFAELKRDRDATSRELNVYLRSGFAPRRRLPAG